MPDAGFNDPMVEHHLYGGPASGTVMAFSGNPRLIRYPIPGTAHQPEVGVSRLMEMATYIRVSVATPSSPSAVRYVHEDIARLLFRHGLTPSGSGANAYGAWV